MNKNNLLINKYSYILSKTFLIFGRLLLEEPNKLLLDNFKNLNLLLNWYIEPVKHVDLIADLIPKSVEELKKDDILSLLKQDYTNLFIFGDLEIRAIPWASVYLNKNNETFTEETLLIKNIYSQYNFNILNSFKEPIDHIGVILTFLGFLLNNWNNLSHMERVKTHQTINHVIADFLLTWFPSFFNKFSNGASTYFYKLVSYLLDDFLFQVKDLLNVKVKSRKIYF